MCREIIDWYKRFQVMSCSLVDNAMFGETASHLYPKDQMFCMCTKSKIGKGRAKSKFFPPNKGTRLMGPEKAQYFLNR